MEGLLIGHLTMNDYCGDTEGGSGDEAVDIIRFSSRVSGFKSYGQGISSCRHKFGRGSTKSMEQGGAAAITATMYRISKTKQAR
jgi:hypothetical protein